MPANRPSIVVDATTVSYGLQSDSRLIESRGDSVRLVQISELEKPLELGEMVFRFVAPAPPDGPY